MPMGCHVSDPTPVPIASGSIPRMVVNEVMSTGRRRLFPPAITASKTPEPRSDLGVLFILIVILVYIVMATQFESLLFPFIIMFTIPFAAKPAQLAEGVALVFDRTADFEVDAVGHGIPGDELIDLGHHVAQGDAGSERRLDRDPWPRNTARTATNMTSWCAMPNRSACRSGTWRTSRFTTGRGAP